MAARHYTLLLLDMSGSVTKSGQLPALQAAVDRFIERVSKLQETAINAFDGRADLIPLRGFGPPAPINLSGFITKDPSTNLHGAIVKGIDVLAKQLERSPAPLRFGTLVVFTDGTDHAHRVSRNDARRAIDAVDFDVSSKRFYLLSYCSPARAGQHRLAIEPFTPDGKKGRLVYVFDADGFGPECDPNRKPAFDVRRPKLDGVRR